MHEETLKLRTSKLGPDHPDTLTSRNNLALPTSRRSHGRGDRAPRETLRLRRRSSAPTTPTPSPAATTSPSPTGRRPDGPGDRAARGDAQAAVGEARPRPPRHAHQPQQPRPAYQAAGRTAEAIALLDETLKLRRRSSAPTTPRRSPAATTSPGLPGRRSTAEAIAMHEETLALTQQSWAPTTPTRSRPRPTWGSITATRVGPRRGAP